MARFLQITGLQFGMCMMTNELLCLLLHAVKMDNVVSPSSRRMHQSTPAISTANWFFSITVSGHSCKPFKAVSAVMANQEW